MRVEPVHLRLRLGVNSEKVLVTPAFGVGTPEKSYEHKPKLQKSGCIFWLGRAYYQLKLWVIK